MIREVRRTKMRQLWLIVCASTLAWGVMSVFLANHEQQPKAVMTREAAVEIAEKAFMDATHGQIRKFRTSDSSVKSDDGQWHLFVEGTGEFSRPGYHATVSVDKKTGKASISMGE